MALHTGHRRRVRDKFRTGGFSQFADHEILEALLFCAVPYRDTNPLAHTLIERGGSLAGAFSLTPEELRTVPMAPTQLPLYLALLQEVARRASHYDRGAETPYLSLRTVRSLAAELVRGVTDDRTLALFFDGAGHLLATQTLFCGYYASAAFRVQELVTAALNARASTVVLVSTHATRIARPDPNEVAASRHFASVLQLVGVTLADHLIFGGSVCMSVTHVAGALLRAGEPQEKLGDEWREEKEP